MDSQVPSDSSDGFFELALNTITVSLKPTIPRMKSI